MNVWRRAPIASTLGLILFVPIALAGAAWIIHGVVPLSTWVRWTHPSYKLFLRDGGRLTPRVLEAVSSDPDRDQMVRRRTLLELRRLYPFLVDESRFPSGTYKHENRPVGDHVLWFHGEDGDDWCVVVTEHDEVFNRIVLVKG